MVVRRCILVLSAILIGSLAALPASTAANDDVYKGKTITLLVGFGPGGGNDLYARMLARHMGKHIPGRPIIIVENMPGEGSLTAVRDLDNGSAQEGTMIATFQSGTITQSIVMPEKVKIDFRKYSWVGVASGEVRVCYGYGPKGVRSWSDLMSRKQFVLGTTSKGSASYINGATLRKVFGAPIKHVLGYPGANAQRLAVERGELDGDCGGVSSIPADWIRDGEAHMFVRFSEDRPPEIPASAVYIRTLAKTDAQRQILDMLSATDRLGRVFITSKKVPSGRLQILRRAFEATMKDKDFLADAAKQKLPIDPLTGEQAEQIVDKILSAPPAVIAAAKQIYE